jgi:hypothetical protein
MKKILFVFAVILTGSLLSCKDVFTGKQDALFSPLDSDPGSIKWIGSPGEVRSYQAAVEVYSINNRTDPAPKLRQNYRIAVKAAGEKTYTRLDFEGKGVRPGRSIVSDGNEVVSLDPSSGRELSRSLARAPDVPFVKYMGGEGGLSRVNLTGIREEAGMRALDIAEQKEGRLVIDIPQDQLPQTPFETIPGTGSLLTPGTIPWRRWRPSKP